MTQEPVETTGRDLYVSLSRDLRLMSVVLLSFLGTLGLNAASPALPAIADTLAVSDARVGLVITAYTLPAMVLVPLTGILADIYGRRAVFLPAILLYGVAGTSIAFVSTFESILALRAVQGMAFAGIMPISVTVLGDLYSGPRGATAQGFRVGANGISSLVIPAAAGLLAGIAWNYPFLIYAFFIPIFIVTLRYLPETAGERGRDRRITTTVRRYGQDMRAELAQLDLGILIAGGSVRDFVRYGIITFVPLFAVRVLDASFAQAGAVLSARGIAYIVVAPLSGVVVVYASRKLLLLGALVFSAGATALMPLSSSIGILAFLLFAYSIGDSLYSPVIKDVVTELATDGRRGGVISGMNVLKYGAQTASPAFFGIVLATLGFEYIFFIGAAIALGYAIVVFAFVSTGV